MSDDNLFVSNVLTPKKSNFFSLDKDISEFLEMCKIFILNVLSLSCLCIKSNVEGDVMCNQEISELNYQPHVLPFCL